MKDLVIGLDQGTTGTTVLVVDRDLKVQGKATVPFPQYFPKPGWVEHEPEEIWASVRQALGQALEGLDPDRLAGLGITNQRETTFVWDPETGRPLHRAIVWQDRRTTDLCQAMKPQEAAIRAATGLPLDPYFSATKLRWLRDQYQNQPMAFGTSDAFLAQRLVGQAFTDPSNASRTQVFDLATGGWSPDLLRKFGVEGVALPEIVSTSGICGLIRGVQELPEGLPLAALVGDQQGALFGQGCFELGQAKITYGTGSFILMNTGPKPVASRHGLLTTVAWRLGTDTTFALEGGAFVAGAMVQWLRDGLGLIASVEELEPLARSVPDSGGVTVVPALAGLGAPHWQPEARGLIAGLTRGTTRAHIARATLEGIAHAQADILEAMEADMGAPLADLRVDGGAAANDWLMQLQADFAGVPLARPRLLESTALGAAMLAGLGVGLWPGLEALRRAYPLDRTFQPSENRQDVTIRREVWKGWVARTVPG